MERKIGEIFEYNGEWYQCVVAIQGCRECSFRTHDYCTRHLECLSDTRSDKTSVIFKKLEKVGEPYEFQKRIIQAYELYTTPFISVNMDFVFTYLNGSSTINIIIKQNKEDMGNNNNDAKLSNLFKIGKNLKEFDLEAAKSGKPVCTRDGRKARIICFDRISCDDYYKIVACVTAFDGDFEEVLFYGIDGYIVDSQNPKDEDLMMLPEKKEGWVNVYRDCDASSHRGCRFIYDTKERAVKEAGSAYITTIKINWEE